MNCNKHLVLWKKVGGVHVNKYLRSSTGTGCPGHPQVTPAGQRQVTHHTGYGQNLRILQLPAGTRGSGLISTH